MGTEPRLLGRLALRSQPDSRLVGLSREGSEAAFEEIVSRYRSGLVSFAGAIVPKHRAEDVVQESLTKAHRALSSGDAEINLRPWLYTIVRNRALNDLRDQPIHEHLDENYDGVPQPPDVAARRAELSSLVANLKGLPDAQRQALVQRELEGRSHEEIAAALAITPGAVRGLIFRARGALRDAAAVLVPMPALRYLAGITGSAAGGAAAGAAAGGGGGAIVKIGTGLTVAALAVGSGVAIRDHESGHDAIADAATISQKHAPGAGGSAASNSAGGTAAGESVSRGSGTSETAGDPHAESSGSASSGSGGGGVASGDSSGSGSGSTHREPGDDHGGDNSGPGGGDDSPGGEHRGGGDDSGSGSEHSGSGSGDDGSGSSGSGSDNSGSGSDDHSGPGGGGDDDPPETDDPPVVPPDDTVTPPDDTVTPPDDN